MKPMDRDERVCWTIVVAGAVLWALTQLRWIP